MLLEIKPILNEKLFLRNPEETDLGKKIIEKGILLMHKIGFEQFTFKKLAIEIGTTEAGIYRYFENKHRFLHYLIAWHWNYMEYLMIFHLQNVKSAKNKIKKMISLLVTEHQEQNVFLTFDKEKMYDIVVRESSKVYLTKEVTSDNAAQLFKPYKDLCARMASIFSSYNAAYPYPSSLASTVVEMSHYQLFFAEHLPRLTNRKKNITASKYVVHFLENLVFSTLDNKELIDS